MDAPRYHHSQEENIALGRVRVQQLRVMVRTCLMVVFQLEFSCNVQLSGPLYLD